MRYFVICVMLSTIFSCNQENDKVQHLQATIDSLQKKLSETYKPGFGEFMSGIQTHHAKLWFAGQDQNWPLADFEVHEIEEALEDIRKFCSDRPETKAIGMIDAAIDSITGSIQQKKYRIVQKQFYFIN